MAKVSILVPIYNVEKYLRQCLDSIVNQSLKDIEIICINDGSTDNSLDIINEYKSKDDRIKLINKQNSGYGHSMNMGLDIAQGEYIGIVEPDDYADLNMFEILYTKAAEDELDIVKSDWINWWGETNNSIKFGAMDKNWCDKVFDVDAYKEVLNIMPAIWSGIYKRSLIVDNGIRFMETAGASYQDTGFYFKAMLCAKRIMLIDEAYLHYRQDNPNSSVKSKEKAFAICVEFDGIERFMKERGLTNQLEYVYSIMFKSYAHNLLRLDDSLVKDFIERFSEKFKQVYENENLGELFFSRCKRKHLMRLIADKNKAYRKYMLKRKYDRFNNIRKSLISINISSQRFSIKLLGKEVIRLG